MKTFREFINESDTSSKIKKTMNAIEKDLFSNKIPAIGKYIERDNLKPKDLKYVVNDETKSINIHFGNLIGFTIRSSDAGNYTSIFNKFVDMSSTLSKYIK